MHTTLLSSASAERSIMGIPASLEADDPRLLEAVLAGLAAWPELPPGIDAPALRLRLSLGSEPGRGAPEVTVVGRVLRLEGRGTVGGADARRGEAWCTVPPELAFDPERLGAEVVDPLLLFLLTRSGRVPVHAAGVCVGNTAVILAGPSGAGKSTLAHAALRAGLDVLSDDTLFVESEPDLRVWGYPRPIHLLPDSAAAAGAQGALRLRGGRWKLAVPSATAVPPPTSAPRAVLCLLARGDAVSLRPLPVGEAVAALLRTLEPGFNHFRAEMPELIRALAADGVWRLTLSADPEEAVEAILELGD
jgi:hypothetical protein